MADMDAQPTQMLALSADLKTFITATLDEYLVITHADETAHIILSRLADSSKRLPFAVQVEIVKRSVYLVLDRKLVDGERLGSLLSQLYFKGILSADSIATGLRIMSLRLPDLGLDNKFAGQALVSFATWLVVSDVLDEDFLAPSSSASLLACAHEAHVDLPPQGPLPPYIAPLHDQLQHSLRSRLPHPLLAIRGMQREALASYLASGGMGLEPFVYAVSGPESVGGIGQAAGYSKHELARSLWLAQLEPERAVYEAAHCMKLPPKRPQLRRAHSDDSMDASPGGHAGASTAGHGHGGSPVLPLTLPMVREFISQLFVELHSMGLLSSWDITTGAISALCKASGGVPSPAGTGMAQAVARAVGDGVMQAEVVSQTLPTHAFSNEWTRYLAAERIYTGEWVVVREPGPSFASADATGSGAGSLLSGPHIMALAAKGGVDATCWGWQGTALKDIGIGASNLGKALVQEVSTGSDARALLAAGLPSLAAKTGGMDLGAREVVRVALVEAATGGKAPAARIAATLQSFSLPEPPMRMGCLLAVDSLYASLLAGTGKAEQVQLLGDILGHMVAAGVITGGDALWSMLPRRLLLAAKLDSEGGEAGEEYLNSGSAAALLTVLKARVAAIAGQH